MKFRTSTGCRLASCKFRSSGDLGREQRNSQHKFSAIEESEMEGNGIVSETPIELRYLFIICNVIHRYKFNSFIYLQLTLSSIFRLMLPNKMIRMSHLRILHFNQGKQKTKMK